MSTIISVVLVHLLQGGPPAAMFYAAYRPKYDGYSPIGERYVSLQLPNQACQGTPDVPT